MLEDVRYNANTNISSDDARIKSSDFAKRPSFKGEPNAVDTTPKADTYQGQQLPPEMGFGEKFVKYGLPAGASLYLLSEFFNKSNQGEYEKSLLGRLGRFGDWLSGTKVINNRFVDFLKRNGATAKNSAQAFIDRHETLSAMQKTPTKPTCPLVTNFLETQNESDLKHGVTKLKDFFAKNPKTLKLAGATEAEINALKSKFGTGLFGRVNQEQKAVEEFLIDKIGKDIGRTNMVAGVEKGENALRTLLEERRAGLNTPGITDSERIYLKQEISRLENKLKNYRSNVLKHLKLKSMGLNQTTLEAMQKEPLRYGAQIEQSLGTAAKYSPKMSEFYNKVKSATAPATKLGRFLPKAAKLGIRGLTFGGGLMNCMLMLSFFMMDAVKNTVDAPKDQKVATGVHGLFDAMSWIVAMPLAVKAMHAVNGLKNLGKTEAQVKAYETAYQSFKQTANARGFATKADYDAAWQNVERLKNVGTKPKGIKWVLSKLAKFTSIGLEQKPAYKEATRSFSNSSVSQVLSKDNLKAIGGNLKRWSKNMPRNWIGYPLRFALYMFAFQPLVDKLFTTPIKAIFGKPYEPDEIREKFEKEQEKQQIEAMRKQWLYPGPAIMPNPDAVKGLDNVDVASLPDNNLIKKELIKKGIVQPNSNNVQPNKNFTNINGVQVDVRHDNNPFMPAINPNTNSASQTGIQPVNGQEKDPNKSDYDTVPRSFTPEINMQNPVPYSDPYANPANERNYDNLQKSLEKSDKFITETEKWIENNYED